MGRVPNVRSLTSETLREAGLGTRRSDATEISTLAKVFDGLVEDFQGRLQRSYPMAYIEPSDRWREEVLAKIGRDLSIDF